MRIEGASAATTIFNRNNPTYGVAVFEFQGANAVTLASLTITEPTAGSDAIGMKTRFTPEGDSVIVDGMNPIAVYLALRDACARMPMPVLQR